MRWSLCSRAWCNMPQGAQMSKGSVQKDVRYRESAHPAHTMDVFLPAQCNGAALLFIHGGGWRGGSKAQWQAHAQRYTGMGYVCACATYRLVPDAVFPAQVEDCQAALQFLRAQASTWGFDAERIAAIGSSSGGHLATMLGAMPDVGHRPHALVCLSAITDTTLAEDTPDKLRGLIWNFAPQEAAHDNLRALSPVHLWDSDTPPTLLIHGLHDDTVPCAQSRRAQELLTALGVPVHLHLLADGPHGFAYGLPHQPEESEQYKALRAMDAFLMQTLCPQG